jgi:hypothetical protein
VLTIAAHFQRHTSCTTCRVIKQHSGQETNSGAWRSSCVAVVDVDAPGSLTVTLGSTRQARQARSIHSKARSTVRTGVTGCLPMLKCRPGTQACDSPTFFLSAIAWTPVLCVQAASSKATRRKTRSFFLFSLSFSHTLVPSTLYIFATFHRPKHYINRPAWQKAPTPP